MVMMLLYGITFHNLDIVWEWKYDEFVNGRYVRSGIGIVFSCDFNGDGYDDIIVNVCRADLWVHDLFIFSGADMDTFPELIIEGMYAEVYAGDVNGDGCGDISLIKRCGRYYENRLYFGNPDFDSSYIKMKARLKYIGDVNGDGYDDAAMKIRYTGFIETPESIFVLYGGPDFDTVPDVRIGKDKSMTTGWGFGTIITSAGDFNGDGYGDMLIGWDDFSQTRMYQGRMCIYFGGDSMDGYEDVCYSETFGSHQYLGCMVGGIENLGVAFSTGSGDEVYVLYGARPPKLYYDSIPDMRIEVADGEVCQLPRFMGDVNGDGIGDLVVGDRKAGEGGMLYVYLMGYSGDNELDAYVEGDTTTGLTGINGIGHSVEMIDIDGDGVEEILLPDGSRYVHHLWVLRYREGGGRGEDGEMRVGGFDMEDGYYDVYDIRGVRVGRVEVRGGRCRMGYGEGVYFLKRGDRVIKVIRIGGVR